MKLTATQLRQIIAEEVKAVKRLHEAPMQPHVTAARQSAKAALLAYVEAGWAAADGDPQDVQDEVHSALDELMREVFSEAGFSEMPLGYYQG